MAETNPPRPCQERRQYPPYVADEVSRRRWDLWIEVAMHSFNEAEHSETVWQATRALYFSDIPTDP